MLGLRTGLISDARTRHPSRNSIALVLFDFEMGEPFLIIGDGVFGLSTSYHLRRQERQFRICAKAEAHAPSQDIAKISRTDYPGMVRMKEAQAAHEAWTTDNFYKVFCTKVGRVVAYDFENSATLRKINENRQRCNLERREILDARSFTEAFGGVQTSGLAYVYNDDDALIDWASVMKSLHSAVESETAAPVRRLIPGPNRVDAVVIDHPVYGEEMFDTTNVKIILAAGPWAMTLLDHSGIDGPPAGLSLTALLAFHLAIDDEQYAFYSAKPIFSHIGTGKRRSSPCVPADANISLGEILPPVCGQKVMKVTWTRRPFTTISDWLLCPPDLSRSAFVAREVQAMRRWLLQSHPRLRKAQVTTHFYWSVLRPFG